MNDDDRNHIKTFDCHGDEDTLGLRWKRWLIAFKLFADGKGLNHIKTFDCHGAENTLGLRWKRWLIAFELFADGKGLILDEENANNRQRRLALLIHLAGTDVKDIFHTLPDTGDAKDLL